MMFFKKCVYGSLLLVLTTALISINAQAEDLTPHGPAPFSEFDKDASGFISEEEFNTTRSQRMAAMAAEGKQMRGAASAPTFAEVDSDGDGQLSPDELTAAQNAHMEKVHSMGKGHGAKHCTGHGEAGCGGKGDCKGNCKGHGEEMGGHMPAFADFDLDGDGKIIEQEFNQGHAKRMSEMAAKGHEMKYAGDSLGFSGIDANADGEISEKEFSTHQAEHHKCMQQGKNR